MKLVSFGLVSFIRPLFFVPFIFWHKKSHSLTEVAMNTL